MLETLLIHRNLLRRLVNDQHQALLRMLEDLVLYRIVELIVLLWQAVKRVRDALVYSEYGNFEKAVTLTSDMYSFYKEHPGFAVNSLVNELYFRLEIDGKVALTKVSFFNILE